MIANYANADMVGHTGNVPAVIKAHGWTDDVVDFVFWVLVRNYYNTLDDYGQVWGAWGLRDAVVSAHAELRERGLDVIDRGNLPGPANPWLPPSSAAMLRSSASRVGFWVRPYSYPLWRPRPSCT